MNSDYLLVPREADHDMNDAGWHVMGTCADDDAASVYAAMLEARPPHCDDLLKAMEECEKALKPFANAIFNDNGDITIDHTMYTSDDLIRAYFVLRRLSSARAIAGKTDLGKEGSS